MENLQEFIWRLWCCWWTMDRRRVDSLYMLFSQGHFLVLGPLWLSLVHFKTSLEQQPLLTSSWVEYVFKTEQLDAYNWFRMNSRYFLFQTQSSISAYFYFSLIRLIYTVYCLKWWCDIFILLIRNYIQTFYNTFT